ncbi:uncharacterized protein L203_101492 [Cryptococcus depauperatus CBS 7841]|uniref:Uncharacterized protein n=1 Tax=Cryptococcus depauperatus CBS 7841 TaxID=1295531 RepID=A0A1E3ITE2_9TREE|nr:hypothetical protein L203_01147 [Cryptococcus depauperatus CBS 7841]
MPSLQQALESLSEQSAQIAYLSSLNSRPPGLFTSAILYLPPSEAPYLPKGNVLHLVRDASESEKRLFKFVGESDGPKGNKRVEKREGEIVTPMRYLRQRGRECKDETDLLLRAVLKMNDDYFPRPRARALIQNLMDQHQKNQERIAELEHRIAEANQPFTKPSPPSPSPQEKIGQESELEAQRLIPGGMIKAEDVALRASKTRLAALKSVELSKPGNQIIDPLEMAAPPPGRNIPFSPPFQPSQPLPPTPTSNFVQPSQAKTPARQLPNVTNSLVNATPRHNIERLDRIDRFSPLKLITPRAGSGIGGGIFGRSRGSLKGSILNKPIETPRTLEKVPSVEETRRYVQLEPGEDVEEADETVRLAREPLLKNLSTVIHGSVSSRSPVNSEPPSERTNPPHPETTRAAPPPPLSLQPEAEPQALIPSEMAENIDVNCESVKAGLRKIWSTMSDIMRQGVSDGESFESEDAFSSVQHLGHLSRSELPPPQSPSASSTLSSLNGQASTKPITPEIILSAHMFLAILQTSSSADKSPGVDMNDMKEKLNGIALARGWTGTAQMATKVIYAAVGKRVVTIDRKGGGLGRVKFTQ